MLWSWGGGEEGEMYGESNMETYIAICKMDSQGEFVVSLRKLKQGLLYQPRGMGWGGRWEGESGWGTPVHPWLIHVNIGQKPPQYCKVISLQLK